jgi:acetyltransferase-like isoleucine patch superfamily enzyme
MGILRIGNKIVKLCFYKIDCSYSWVITWLKFKFNGVSFSNNFRTNGRPIVNVNLKGTFSIGKNIMLNNGPHYNKIGRQQRCYFVVGPNATLNIGDYFGGSCLAIVCHNKITIGNHVKIGGNVVVYDTDFHSLDSEIRKKLTEDILNAKTAPIVIEDHVFIGAHSIILKGVTIGERSIVGAGSVVTKSIPPDEIWAGNPAKFIKINSNER